MINDERHTSLRRISYFSILDLNDARALEKLRSDEDWMKRYMVAANRHTPQDVLVAIKGDVNEMDVIRFRAQINLRRRM